MLLLVGLGNPGSEYARNRHNVGFMAVDAIVHRHGLSAPRARFHGDISEGTLAGEKVLVLKPQTFMNESGQSVGEAVRFYKLTSSDVVVFYDEIDLAPGKLRIKTGGGAAGHNGIRSIDAHLNDKNYRRVRIGVGHPGHRERVHSHVLGNFSKTDQEWLEPALDAIADHAPLLVDGRDSDFMNKVAQAVSPKSADKPAKKTKKSDARGRSPEPTQEPKPAGPANDTDTDTGTGTGKEDTKGQTAFSAALDRAMAKFRGGKN